MLYLVKRYMTSSGRRKLGWSILNRLSGVISPVAVFKITGIFPLRARSRSPLRVTPYTPVQDSAPPEHHEPGSIYPQTNWSVFPVQIDDTSELISIKGGVVTSSGHVFDNRGYLVEQAVHKKRYAPEPGLVPRPWRPFRDIPRIPGTVSSVTASTQWNYYHWLFDVLPRLAMLEDLKAEYDLLYLQNSKRFQKESLSVIGIDNSAILSCEDWPLIRADTILIPCHQSTGRAKYPKWVRDKLRNWFLPIAGEPGPARRVYIGRSKQHGRRIDNEDEIFHYLATLGFEYVLPEQFSFLEQVRIFRDAEYVVAAHGAGMANIVFCKPGVNVVEMFPSETKYTYYKISQLLNLNYFYVKTPGQPDNRMTRNDYHIPLSDLKQTLHLAECTTHDTRTLDPLP